MSSKNEIYVNRDPLSAGPYSCSIQINESVLLTPNITSSKALLKILEKILKRIKNNNEPVFVDEEVFLLIQELKQEKDYEWHHVGVIRSKAGKWKVWLCIGAISVYLSTEEVMKVIEGMKRLDFSSLPVH